MNLQGLFDGDKDLRIYVYGMGVFGLCVFQAMLREGRTVAGIIDNKITCSSLGGVKVYRKDILDEEDPARCLVAITATRGDSVKAIISEVSQKGYRYIVVSNKYNIQIEISGYCNLRCRSCQVCNASKNTFTEINRGFMKPELYSRILDKLRVDYPDVKAVMLYNFGEPFLSPYLCEIVDLTHQKGMAAIISSNLSVKIDTDEVISHNPDCIKVSLSGFSQEIYECTHNNGNIELVKDNLKRLRDSIVKYNSTTQVLVGYHIYNNNVDETGLMDSLCKEYGFIFQPTKALYCNPVKMMHIEEFDPEDIEFINKYYDDPDSIMNCVPDYDREYRCEYFENGLFIDWDGRVMLCCTVRRDDAVMPYSYLDKSIEEINRDRYNHYICKHCVAYGFAKN